MPLLPTVERPKAQHSGDHVAGAHAALWALCAELDGSWGRGGTQRIGTHRWRNEAHSLFMTRCSTMRALLLLVAMGASAAAMSPACSAAYGGDEERYTTDVAVFQRGCAAEKRVTDPCPMACYEIVRKVQ